MPGTDLGYGKMQRILMFFIGISMFFLCLSCEDNKAEVQNVFFTARFSDPVDIANRNITKKTGVQPSFYKGNYYYSNVQFGGMTWQGMMVDHEHGYFSAIDFHSYLYSELSDACRDEQRIVDSLSQKYPISLQKHTKYCYRYKDYRNNEVSIDIIRNNGGYSIILSYKDGNLRTIKGVERHNEL